MEFNIILTILIPILVLITIVSFCFIKLFLKLKEFETHLIFLAELFLQGQAKNDERYRKFIEEEYPSEGDVFIDPNGNFLVK